MIPLIIYNTLLYFILFIINSKIFYILKIIFYINTPFILINLALRLIKDMLCLLIEILEFIEYKILVYSDSNG